MAYLSALTPLPGVKLMQAGLSPAYLAGSVFLAQSLDSLSIQVGECECGRVCVWGGGVGGGEGEAVVCVCVYGGGHLCGCGGVGGHCG